MRDIKIFSPAVPLFSPSIINTNKIKTIYNESIQSNLHLVVQFRIVRWFCYTKVRRLIITYQKINISSYVFYFLLINNFEKYFHRYALDSTRLLISICRGKI